MPPHTAHMGVTDRATRTLRVAFVTALLVGAAGCQNAGTTGPTDDVRLLLTPVPTPTTTPEAQPTAAPVTYVVKAGDTLSGIADMFGLTVDDIVRANSIADPNALQVGQVLTIPGRKQTEASANATGTAQAEVTASPSSGTPSPVIVPASTLPPDATPPQGPPVDEPEEGESSSPGTTGSPTGE
ncbi:MAG: LysM peptidoglycan-binding domain-containing protein [Chloroflexota bacterium]|nr:LysM peptidoglycan-binding domain-containing protein [Chloroflexota bacterium]MDQ5867530.1 LysM peptidoglycan-binding domain-containing protein [Chloroflexota bacterium]